jgi:DNA-directed RNA polymerase specialized sigma24 family protein
MENESITNWIEQLTEGDEQAAIELWRFVSTRVQQFARQKLDPHTRRGYDENDAANSAFHSLCRGITDGRLEARDRNALWGLLAVITSRKISAQFRQAKRLKRGGGIVRGESGFGELGDAGINAVGSHQAPPDEVAEVGESCNQLLDALPDEIMRKIVLLKFQGATNGEVAEEMSCTERTIERKLERIRRIWTKAGLHDAEP